MTEYLRTNYRITGSKGGPGALTSVIVQISGAALSCAGYLFGSTGYGVPSAIFARGLSVAAPGASVKGDGNDSTIAYYGFGPGSVSGSVYFVSVLLRHVGSGAGGTISMAHAASDAGAAASVSVRALLTMVIGSV